MSVMIPWNGVGGEFRRCAEGLLEMGLFIPLAPTRILFCVLFFKKRLTRPQGNYDENRAVSKAPSYVSS